MDEKDIKHLGTLSRIALTDKEVATFKTEIDAILSYVSVVNEIAGDAKPQKVVGSVYNVMRDDEVTVESGSFTKALLREAPETEKGYIKVKKIITKKDTNS